MPPSGGLRIFAVFLLVQVISLADAQQRFVPQGSQYFWSPFRESSQQTGYLSTGPGHNKNEPQHPPDQTEPNFTEDDLIVLIGTDLQVPYPLYKQISSSFLLSKDILVLLPNNTIVTVSGYADLNDITKVDPEETKVLISSDSMIPAPIYLRIVLIRPEEVMVRMPDGEILPNQIYLERYGKEASTTKSGGQTYFTKVGKEDSFPFLVVNEPGHGGTDVSISPPSIPGPGIADKYLESMSDSSKVLEPVHYYDPALARELSRAQHVSYFPNSPVQEPGRGARHIYREPAPRLQNRFIMPHSDPRRSHGERMVLLPPGIHVMDSARCNICDPASPEAHIRILNV